MSELKRCAGKVVLVTGAGHGIGRSVVERFAAEGARVGVNDVSSARADEVVRAIHSVGGEAIVLAADVSSKAQVDAMFDAVLQRFGTIDVLVNNAGLIYEDRHFLDGDEAWWDRVQGVNLKGAFLCSHRAAHVRSERSMRQSIRAIPNGRYEHETWSDGFESPIRIQVAVTVRDEDIDIDFTGSSPQSERGINVVMNYTRAYASFAIKAAVSPEVPHNEGAFRPVHVTAPRGSILNCVDGIPSTAQAPFGGVKMSGIGREGGHWGIDEFLDIKYISMGLG